MKTLLAALAVMFAVSAFAGTKEETKTPPDEKTNSTCAPRC